MRRVRFTDKELELILEMTGIAQAGPPEGDYRDWDTDGKYETMTSLENKVLDLQIRKKKVGTLSESILVI